MNDELICPKCQRIFKMRSHLEEHLLSHFSDAQCPSCERSFATRSKLRLHQLRKDCQKTQHSPKPAPHRHLLAIRGDATKEEPTRRRYPCFICGKSFGQSGSLKSHMIAHRVRTPKTSVHCFYESCVFRSHLRRAHVRHFEAVHGIEGVGCSYQSCVAVFPTMAHMEVHFKSHMTYHCAQCDFACSSKSFLVQHQRKGHKGSEAQACKFCHYVTFNPMELKRHEWHRHAGEKKHGCEQCSYVTSNKRALARHMLTHTGEKPYQCELCDFRCRDETYLPKHMLTHSGERNFLCEECGYVTKWKHSLNVHMRKHGKDLSPPTPRKVSAPLVYIGRKLKRKRKFMTLFEKVKILDLLRQGAKFSAVARTYKMSESTIRSIKKEEDNIRSTLAINNSQTLKRVFTSRNKHIVRMESALVRWIHDCRKKKIPLDTNIMRNKARILYQEFAGVSDLVEKSGNEAPQPGPSKEPVEFLASKGWFDRFKKRYQLKKVSPHWESASADVAAAQKYPETFKSLIQENDYKPEQVFNVRETGLFWKNLPARVFGTKSEVLPPGLKGHNDRVMLIMCGNAAGFLMKPALVHKIANPRCLKFKDKNLLPVFWMQSSKVTATKTLLTEWFLESFIPQAKSYLSEKGLDFRICLMMDNADGHPLDLSYEGVQIEVLPTDVQPLAQGLIRTFKTLYTRFTMQYIADTCGADEKITAVEAWKKFNIATSLEVIHTCLEELKPETLKSCWENLWPECAQNCKGFSPQEVRDLAVAIAIHLAKCLGGGGAGTLDPKDLNDLLETSSDPKVDDNMVDFTPSLAEEAEQEVEELEAEEQEYVQSQDDNTNEGLSYQRLSTIVKTARDLQGMADAWDPSMVRALQIKTTIDGAMKTYKNLLTNMNQQAPVNQDTPGSMSPQEPPEYADLLSLLPPETPDGNVSYGDF
ncbi:uncharacterized protein LOC144204163 [Stigmatopora nigra]